MSRWKLHLSIVTVVVIALSIFFSSPIFIKPLYRSFAIVYPSNLIPYSSETPSEQMLQLLKSEDIDFAVIKKFDLAGHYGIDTTNPTYLSRLKRQYADNVNIKKTEFESIIIEVYDTDPQIACSMVKEIIDLLNLKARNLQREKTAEVVKIYENLMLFKLAQIDSVQGELKSLREDYHIYDYNIQLKEYTRAYLNGVNTGRGNHPVYSEMFNNFNEHGGDFLLLGGYLSSLAGSYNETKILYDQALSDLTKELTYTNLVTNPYPADTKAYPIRWLIVLVSTLSSLALMLIIITIIERLRIKRKNNQTVTA